MEVQNYDKELLLKYLCMALPYGVKINIGEYSDYKLKGIIITDEKPIKLELIENDIPYSIEVPLNIIKPYLRSMSSMTEEEIEIYHKMQSDIWKPCGTMYYDNIKSIDWLNVHHFDFIGLIPKGLAIEVTKENNPYKL